MRRRGQAPGFGFASLALAVTVGRLGVRVLLKDKGMVNTSSGPSIDVSSEEIECKRCSKSFARSAKFFRSFSLILGEENMSPKSQGRMVNGEHTLLSEHLLLSIVAPQKPAVFSTLHQGPAKTVSGRRKSMRM